MRTAHGAALRPRLARRLFAALGCALLVAVTTCRFAEVDAADDEEEAAAGNEGATDREEVFLFIAIMSHGKGAERRRACREAWAAEANELSGVTAKFVLAEADRNDSGAALAEELQLNDIMFIDVQQGREWLVPKIVRTVVWVDARFRMRFFLKTDDDSFVMAPRLLSLLPQLCHTPNCSGTEKIYAGGLQPEGWRMATKAFARHTKKDRSPPYHLGGGWLMTGDLIHWLAGTERQLGLFTAPDLEDAFFGWYINILNYNIHVLPEKAWRADSATPQFCQPPCDSLATLDASWNPCDNPRVMLLHPIKSATMMRELGQAVNSCSNLTAALHVSALKPAPGGHAQGHIQYVQLHAEPEQQPADPAPRADAAPA